MSEEDFGVSAAAASGVAGQEFPRGALYVVGMPIGNAADITLRALWVLGLADCIAAEDTRETRKILSRYGITTPTMSVREFNEVTGAAAIAERLERGERVALVTDAGTPAVSDPGALVVRILRERGLRVIPIPGASAVVTALSAAGLSSKAFIFAGFVGPQAKARREALARLAATNGAFVLYEAPHRLGALLKDLSASLDASRRVVIAREVTKKFEEFSSETAGDLPAFVETHEPRGEYVILVDEAAKKEGAASVDAEEIVRVLASELPASKAASIGTRLTGMPREELYRRIVGERGA